VVRLLFVIVLDNLHRRAQHDASGDLYVANYLLFTVNLIQNDA